MASSSAKTVAAYLAELPPERRAVIAAIRKRIRAKLPKGYAETMGKSCIRFRSLDDLPLEIVGELAAHLTVERYIARYEVAKPPKKHGK